MTGIIFGDSNKSIYIDSHRLRHPIPCTIPPVLLPVRCEYQFTPTVIYPEVECLVWSAHHIQDIVLGICIGRKPGWYLGRQGHDDLMVDGVGTAIFVDHDLHDHKGELPDGIAEAFIDWAKKEKLSFWKNEK